MNRVLGVFFTIIAVAAMIFAILNIGNYTSLCFNSEGSVEDVEPTGVEMIGVDIINEEADAEALNAIVEDAAEESMEENAESAESAEGADVAVE